MSAPVNGKSSVDPKAWLHEIKTNRKTQVALAALVLVVAYLFWPEAPKRPRSAALPARTALVPLDERQLESLRKLKDLAQYDRAGELPSEDRMYRDLFLFDMPAPPPPPPPKPIPPPPPPPPPTPEQIEAARLAQARQEATNSRPQTLRYLGYMGRASSGRIGSFAKGDEIISLRPGDTASPNWELVLLTDTYAEFQHVKFTDIRYRSEAKDSQASPGAPVTNQF